MYPNDRTLAYLELSNDIFFHKIPKNKYSYYIDTSLTKGAIQASSYIGQNIIDLYKKNNIEIEISDSSGEYVGVKFRAQFFQDKEKCKVKIYKKSLEELANICNINSNTKQDFSYDLSLQIHLCHEFFHYLEYKENENVAQSLESIVTFKFLNYTRTALINKCSEISANNFAKILLNLNYLPNYYDYIYLINKNDMTFELFNTLLLEAKEVC